MACFGSRQTPGNILEIMHFLGHFIIYHGGTVASGHCEGADQAFEAGSEAAGSGTVQIYLPWRSYNKDVNLPTRSTVISVDDMEGEETEFYFAEAKKYHPAWEKLTRGTRLMHVRNIMIAHEAVAGICYLNNAKLGFGGSGQAYRYLLGQGKPVFDLGQPIGRSSLYNALFDV